MITQSELKDLLSYDKDTGIFRWNIKPNKKIQKGSIAGYLNGSKRYLIGINRKYYKAHRLAWLYVYGYMPKIIDHINGNPTDNMISNLRECNTAQNALNVGVKAHSKSGIKNVMRKKGRSKWTVRLRVNGVYKHIGNFDDIELAGLVAVEAREKYHGEYARHI